MVFIQLSFVDFITPENYLRLQNTFLQKGQETFKELFEIKPAKDLNITYESKSLQNLLNNESGEIVSVEFFNFLVEAVPKIAHNYFKLIIKEAELKNRYSPEEISHFTKPFLESLNQILFSLDNSYHLSEEIKIMVRTEILKLVDLCESYSENPYSGIKNKVPIKWNRTQVAYFFHLLKENNQLGEISDADLGRVIDNAFLYLKEGAQSEFLPIKNSKKLLSDFKVTSGRPEEPSNNTLEKIFQDNFFAH